MKGIAPASSLIVVMLSFSLFAPPVQAGHHFGHHGCYGHPRYYYGRCVSFGFGWGLGGVYAPAPVYVAPPPVVYYVPPVVVQQPAVIQQPPVMVQQPSPPQAPVFVETNRRLHQHGDNRGMLDWVEGLLDGQPVRIYYDDFGRVKKQKWLD